jgi:tryptophan-rich sensory protein
MRTQSVDANGAGGTGGLDRGDLPGLLVAIVVTELAGIVPAILTANEVAEWYPTLASPPLTPPSWVFGPVWTVLFAALGVAAYLVYREREHEMRAFALGFFGVQLALNTSWSLVFFGMQAPAAALVVIVLLLVAIAATIVAFDQVDRRAALLMVPYLAWVAFATYLNAGFWYLN